MHRPPRVVLHVVPHSLTTPSCLQMYWLDPASYGLWGLATSQLGDITHVSISVQPGMVGARVLAAGRVGEGIARRGSTPGPMLAQPAPRSCPPPSQPTITVAEFIETYFVRPLLVIIVEAGAGRLGWAGFCWVGWRTQTQWLAFMWGMPPCWAHSHALLQLPAPAAGVHPLFHVVDSGHPGRLHPGIPPCLAAGHQPAHLPAPLKRLRRTCGSSYPIPFGPLRQDSWFFHGSEVVSSYCSPIHCPE